MNILKRLWRRLRRRRPRHQPAVSTPSMPPTPSSPRQSPSPPPVLTKDCAFDGQRLRQQVEGVPDVIASLLLTYLGLSSSELASVVECCSHPVFYEHWVTHTRLRIHPDAARSGLLLQSLATRTREAPRPVHFAVVDTYQLSQLLSIRDDVQAVTLDRDVYAHWPERPFEPAALRWFPRLVCLEVHNLNRLPLDLHALGLNAPQLQSLKIKEAYRLQNDLRHSTELRELWLESTNIESLAIAEGLSKLSALTIKTRISRYTNLPHPLHDIERLTNVAPLSRLVLRGEYIPRESPTWVSKHLPTLKSLATFNAARELFNSIQPLRGVYLRELRLGSHDHIQLEWLKALPKLERLQLVISTDATHCRPIRRLQNLQELWITQGWLCDLVGYLPKLSKLVCEDTTDAGGRARLGRRQGLSNGVSDWVDDAGNTPKLRELAIRGRVTIDESDPVVQRMLQSVKQIELFQVRTAHAVNALVRCVARLPQLERVVVRDCVQSPELTECVFTSVASLTEFFLWSHSGRSLPEWLVMQATQLRVLGFDSFTCSLDTCRMPSLTHIYSTFGHVAPRSLPYLRVLSLPPQTKCEPFREERGPGRLLPSLQSILHPVADCLWSEPCCLVSGLRLQVERTEQDYDPRPFTPEYMAKVAQALLVPSWGQPWEELSE